ncbi:MAG: 50S ribosomal protein L30 [Bacteroidota bacterium]
MGKIKVTQVKSIIGQSKDKKRTMVALGLKRINQSVVHQDTPSTEGMISRVHHLVTVQEYKS